jgi:cell division protease FtsH
VRTPGFAGADLANVINEAALLAARRDKEAITTEELEEAIERSVAGLERKSRVLSAKERRIVAYHEAGHAIVGEVLPKANSVQKISIVSRGVAALGYTLNMPDEDRYLMTKEEILDTLCMTLGGRAAEETVFNEISTGAVNDLQQATQMAEGMVKEYGMSDKLGLVAHRQDRGPQYLGVPAAERSYSEETAREIDQEVARFIGDSYERAKKLIEDKRAVLENVVEILFEKEVMDGDELRTLLDEGDAAKSGERENDPAKLSKSAGNGMDGSTVQAEEPGQESI